MSNFETVDLNVLRTNDISDRSDWPTLLADTDYVLGKVGVCSNWEVKGDELYIGFSSEGATTRLRVTREAFQPVLDFLNEHADTTPDVEDLQADVNDAVIALTGALVDAVEAVKERVTALEEATKPQEKTTFPAWESTTSTYPKGSFVTMDGVDYVAVMNCEPNPDEGWESFHIRCWEPVK
jgi:hypothetical protein